MTWRSFKFVLDILRMKLNFSGKRMAFLVEVEKHVLLLERHVLYCCVTHGYTLRWVDLKPEFAEDIWYGLNILWTFEKHNKPPFCTKNSRYLFVRPILICICICVKFCEICNMKTKHKMYILSINSSTFEIFIVSTLRTLTFVDDLSYLQFAQLFRDVCFPNVCIALFRIAARTLSQQYWNCRSSNRISDVETI